MSSTVPMDDAIRTLSKEMANDKDASIIGKTEAEKEILAHYAKLGRRRAAMGAICGSSIMAGLWKLSKNKKKVAGVFAMLSGGLFGASYGIISIRRDLFTDLLMLPSDKSPFATRARTILQTKIPDNPFVQDLNEKFKRSAATIDSWSEEANASVSSTPKSAPKLTPVPRHHDDTVSNSVPPIRGLDIPRGKKDLNEEDHEAYGVPNSTESRSLFFFGAKPQPAERAPASTDRDAPLSRDPYARSSQESHYSGADTNLSVLRHDEDEYFFDVPNETETPIKPTTWDEIRRRAAQQRK